MVMFHEYPDAEPMLSQSAVAAVVTFGTVRRSPSEPYSVGPGKDYQPEALRANELKVGIDQYASVLRDYCNTGDQYCAKSSSPLDLEFHLTYFEQYQKEVVDWVVHTVKKGETSEAKEAIANPAKTPPKTATCTKGGAGATQPAA